MLKDKELIEALSELGIDAENYPVLSLLPFILVAWSDGEIQRAERSRIIELARAKGFIEGEGGGVANGGHLCSFYRHTGIQYFRSRP